jgi:subtilisin
VIVVLKSRLAPGRHAANKARAAEVAQGLGLAPSHSYGTALYGFAARVPKGRLAALERDPRVEFVSADGEVKAIAQLLPIGIDRVEADRSSTASGDGQGTVQGPGIAILDTGIDPNHPDINVAGGVNCNGKSLSFNDGNGHGTHVAGTVAAKDDDLGVVGVAPGAPVYAVRVLNDKGFGKWSAIVCGVDWVSANAAHLGIEVANMSLLGPGFDDGACGETTKHDALHKAICQSVNVAQVTYVVGAGNANSDFAEGVPAAYDEVLTVTAMTDYDGQPGGGGAITNCDYPLPDGDDSAADFSNWTPVGSPDEGHTIAAPGVCIRSTWTGGGYETISGTSMASPHVAGVAALCIASGNCTGGPASVISKLRSDATAQAASYGFVGDPRSPITVASKKGATTRYYGYLVYAGGY